MQVTIIGTGLIGCSLGMALKKSGHHITGVDHNIDHLEKALLVGGIDEAQSLEDGLAGAQLVVLCVPVDAACTLLPIILDQINDQAVVMDMGSTKEAICRVADNHSKREKFVAVHPMAGVEHSGPLAAHVDLFDQARVIICNAHHSSIQSLNVVLEILQQIRMNVIFMHAEEHDRQLALVSHLPQFIAYALASLSDFSNEHNKQWVQLGGGGLQSSIRLGKSDASMWIPIFEQNKENLLGCIDRYIEKLQQMKDLVNGNDRNGMNTLIHSANVSYEKLYYRNAASRPMVTDKTTKVFYS
jgi:prephenate dehydrogenase